MSNEFIPFDEFARKCIPAVKSLHETMQENCNDRLKPKEETCTIPCPLEEPLPSCPIRPVGFVPLDEYDVNFKYPLASSRKPAPRPNLPDPGPEPETEA